MVMRALRADDLDAILVAFNDAFSDYVVPLVLTREQLAEMLRRRGWAPEASIAAFEGDRIVAFTLNGVEGGRGYDTGTGVVPTHRRQGLSREMMRRSMDLLRDRGCSSYVLEVIEENVKAAELYRSMGFRETRKLQVWRYEAQRRRGSEAQRLRGAEAQRGALVNEGWWDVQPSWQNSAGSVKRAGAEHVTIGDENGYAIVFPGNGDVPQLAVRRETRRRGIGTRLIEEAAAIADKPLRITNVDDRDRGIAAFLEAVGATRVVRQLEMILPL